jgi:hypothetical protein
MDRTGYIPRFHPLICERNGVVSWYIADGHADTEHSLAVPYLEVPCADKAEAKELAILLNEEYEQE